MNHSACRECDACSDVCPITEIRVARNISDVLSRKRCNPWLCCSCHLCEEACPAGLSARDALFDLRRLQQEASEGIEKKIHSYMRKLRERGFLTPVGKQSNEERAELGLQPIDYQEIACKMKIFIEQYEKIRKSLK